MSTKLHKQLQDIGIKNIQEIFYNPSFEFLYEKENSTELEGFERVQNTEFGAVNVMTGIYTGRSPKDKYILKDENTKRIVFHDITKKAILKAVENPRDIDYNMVNAQQARRVLDRLVGYELSPVLWRKVKGGLSAGRVQSVAVRLIVERERSIQEFKAESHYKVVAEFATEEGKTFKATIPKNFSSKKAAEAFLNSCSDADFTIADLTKKPAKKSPAAPFTTSTLQQEASRKLGFPVGKTMQVAQRLYEAGLITYMRTDSVNLSVDARNEAEEEIIASYGKAYSKQRTFKSKAKGAQEAHEAIRPTNMKMHSISTEYDQNRLYDLIWKRTLASQMSDAQLERTNVKIENSENDKVFTANGEMIKFDGFLKVYLEGKDDDEEEQAGMLPNLKVNDGHRYSVLPVRIKVRPLPDAPIFYPSPDIFLVAKEGARFNLEISLIIMTYPNVFS